MRKFVIIFFSFILFSYGYGLDINSKPARKFLNSVHEKYLQGKKNFSYDGLLEMRKELAKAKKEELSLSEKKNIVQSPISFYKDLHTSFFGDGQTELENKLIDLDIEYWLKQQELDTMFFNKKLSSEEYEEKTVLLEMKKIDEMAVVSSQFPDEEASRQIALVKEIFVVSFVKEH